MSVIRSFIFFNIKYEHNITLTNIGNYGLFISWQQSSSQHKVVHQKWQNMLFSKN